MNIKTAVSTGLLLAGLTSFAADSYWLKTSSADAFTDLSCWIDKDGNAPAAWDSSAVYAVSNRIPGNATDTARVLYTSTTAETFAGGRVRLTGISSKEEALYVQCTDPVGATIPGGVDLGNYSRVDCPRNAKVYLNADLATLSAESGVLPIVWPGGPNAVLTLNGKITGTKGSSAWMRFDTRYSSYGPFDVRLVGDLSEYEGTFEMYSRVEPTTYVQGTSAYNIKFVFANGTCPATFYPHNSSDSVTNFCANIYAVNACTDVFRLKKFGLTHNSKWYSIQNGMEFEFPVDGEAGQCGEFRIYQKLNPGYEVATNVIIRLVGDPRGATTNKFATLSVPAATPLDVNKLKLKIKGPADAPAWYDAKLSIEERTADDGVAYSTVFVTVAPKAGDTVTLVKSDPSTHSGDPSTSAFLTAASWSNEKVPETGHEYLVDGRSSLMALRTPCTSTAVISGSNYRSIPSLMRSLTHRSTFGDRLESRRK